MKYSPIDLKTIPCQVSLKMADLVKILREKSRLSDQGQIFLIDILLDENGSGLT